MEDDLLSLTSEDFNQAQYKFQGSNIDLINCNIICFKSDFYQNLQKVQLSQCILQEFTVTENLKDLSITRCTIELINFEGSQLEYLKLCHNVSLSLVSTFPISLKELTVFDILSFSVFQRYITKDLAIKTPDQLQQLVLIHSERSAINLNKNLQTLILERCDNIQSFSIINSDNINISSQFVLLKQIHLQQSRLIDFTQQLPSILTVTAQQSSIVTLDLSISVNLKDIHYDDCSGMVFKNDFIPNYLEKLFLRTCKYININLQYCKVLQIINIDCCEELKIQNGIIPSQLRILQANKIQNLKLCVKNCIKLEEIHLDQSSEIKIDGLPPNLLYFSAQNSNITGVNIANSLLLEKLYLTNCQQYKQEPIYFNPTNTKLTSLNVPGTNILLTSALLPDTLIQADFSNSNIKHLDLTIAESLQVLKCRNSDNLRFSNSFIPTFVFSLQLIHCNVQNLDLRNCSQLKTFILIQKQQIQLVNDYIPYCVKYLNIGDNVISQLNLTQFNSLTDLTITASQISLFKGFLPANMQKLEIHESVININLQQQKWPFIIENISSDIAFTNNFIPFWFEDHYRSNTRYRNIRFKILLDIQAMIQQINTVQFEVESEIAKCNRFIF